jgi:hypothetical protein
VRSSRLIAAVALGAGLLAAIVLVRTTPDAPLVQPGPRRPTETSTLQIDPPPRPLRAPPPEIGGPQGIHCVLPSGWLPGTRTGLFAEATRSGPGRTFFRLGGTAKKGRTDLLTARLAEEKAFHDPTYERLKLERLSYRSAPAVLWEFTVSARRVRVLNWRERDAEYFIYLSAPAELWGFVLDVAFQDLLAHVRVDTP